MSNTIKYILDIAEDEVQRSIIDRAPWPFRWFFNNDRDCYVTGFMLGYVRCIEDSKKKGGSVGD